MLEIAVLVLVVLLVLFGICAFLTIRSLRDEDDYDDEPEAFESDEDTPEKPKRAKKPKKEPEIAAEKAPEEPVKVNADPKAKTEKKPESKPESKPEKVEAKLKSPMPVNETPAGDSGETRRIVLPSEKPAAVKDDDKFRTRVVTKEEMAQIKAAATEAEAPAVKNAVKLKDEPLTVTDNIEADEDDIGFNPVPFVIVGVVLLLVLAAVAFLMVRSSMVNSHDNGIVNEPKTITATVSNIIQETDFAGSIECDFPDVRYFAAGGKVKSVNVAEGDHVQRGQVLYTIDSSSLEERIELLNQRLENATVTEEKTVEDNVEIRATAAGTIGSLNVSEGSSVREGDTIASMSSVSDYRVTLDFDAEQTGKIVSGDTAKVKFAGETIDGTVTAVRETEDDDTSIYTVTISFRPSTAAMGRAGAEINGISGTGNGDVVSGSKVTTVIRASHSGTVSDIRVKNGDNVREGAVIAVLSTTGTVTESRTDELAAQDIKLQIEQLENELQNYTVKAEVSGYVQHLYLKEGDNTAVNMQAAIVIPDGSLYLKVAVDEENADMTVPATARFKLVKTNDASVPDEAWKKVSTSTEYTGIMDAVSPDPDNAKKYSGHIILDEQVNLRAGMIAAVSVVTYSKYDALLVPAKLIHDGKVSVWRANRIEEVPVVTGITTDDGFVEIISGINGVDKIVVDDGSGEE
ncbi:MAG: biotin/lipoyl-binding protein [Oscillospiraceae bacterium]|nr:biotin/lipoyl-binding protein [Oscillospiraceae bacterium]